MVKTKKQLNVNGIVKLTYEDLIDIATDEPVHIRVGLYFVMQNINKKLNHKLEIKYNGKKVKSN